MQKQITFIIGDGQVTIETTNFKGPACEAATKAFTEALGGQVVSNIKKTEFHQVTSQSNAAKQGN